MAARAAPSPVGGRCRRREAKPAIKFDRAVDLPPGSQDGPTVSPDDLADEAPMVSDQWIALTEADVSISSHKGNVVVTWAPPGHGTFYVAREYTCSRDLAIAAFLEYLNG